MNVFDKYFKINNEKLNIENDIKIKSSDTYIVNRLLTDNINFEVGDMFKEVEKIEDNSNTVLFCRNSLGYFEKPQIEEFIKKVNDKLNKNSLFVVGKMETTCMSFMNAIKESGFKEIIPCVFKKLV